MSEENSVHIKSLGAEQEDSPGPPPPVKYKKIYRNKEPIEQRKVFR